MPAREEAIGRTAERSGTIWAAGGTPFSVFALTPQQLRSATGAEWVDIRA